MVRAAARLTTAGCRVFRSSVAGAQSRVSSGSLARSLVGIYFFLRTGSGRPMGAWVRSSWESSRKHGREFPTLRPSVWLVWRAFRAVS